MEELTITEKLLNEFSYQREELNKMVKDLEELKERINSLFPKEIDYKTRFVFEERVKSATELFKAILDIRKEILKSLKDEIDLRKRHTQSDDESDIEDQIDISRMADRMEQLRKNRSGWVKKDVSMKSQEDIE